MCRSPNKVASIVILGLAQACSGAQVLRAWVGFQAGMHQWEGYEAKERAYPKYQLKPYS